jgi:hypothetical protein
MRCRSTVGSTLSQADSDATLALIVVIIRPNSTWRWANLETLGTYYTIFYLRYLVIIRMFSFEITRYVET